MLFKYNLLLVITRRLSQLKIFVCLFTIESLESGSYSQMATEGTLYKIWNCSLWLEIGHLYLLLIHFFVCVVAPKATPDNQT